MWQRIQSLYLFLAIILNTSIFWLDLAQVKLNNLFHNFDMYSLVDSDTGVELYNTLTLSLLCTISILLSLVVFMMFKKRQLQMKLTQLNLFIQVAFVSVIFFVVDGAATELGSSEVVYEAGSFLAIPPLMFIYLALRSIKKDEALVRSADRIR